MWAAYVSVLLLGPDDSFVGSNALCCGAPTPGQATLLSCAFRLVSAPVLGFDAAQMKGLACVGDI